MGHKPKAYFAPSACGQAIFHQSLRRGGSRQCRPPPEHMALRPGAGARGLLPESGSFCSYPRGSRPLRYLQEETYHSAPVRRPDGGRTLLEHPSAASNVQYSEPICRGHTVQSIHCSTHLGVRASRVPRDPARAIEEHLRARPALPPALYAPRRHRASLHVRPRGGPRRCYRVPRARFKALGRTQRGRGSSEAAFASCLRAPRCASSNVQASEDRAYRAACVTAT
ncbi:hypothetical protein C8Q77DRAFT_920318 [Trametes polyzona]|nr:hypothetical protein C8Q77DRAFT_920318 [Trametes polyzona]